MKKILCFILLLAGVTMVTSCGEDDATYTPIAPLEILSNNVLFETAGGTGTITVNTSDALTATTAATWLSVSVSGNTVTVTAPENTSLNGRSGLIELKAGGKTANITATQKGLAFGVTEGLEYKVDDQANVLELNFSNSLAPTVKSLDEWIQPTLDGTKLTLAIAENNVRKARSGQVVVACGDYADTIVVNQDALTFEVPENQLQSNDNKEASFELTILASKEISLSGDASWIDAEFSENAIGYALTITIPDNEEGGLRTGHLFIKCGDEVESIFIAQFDITKEVASGYYVFWYYDANAGDWSYMPAYMDLEQEAMVVQLSDDLMYTIPVIFDPETLALYAGPSTEFAGMYGQYYCYWVWRSTAGTWSGYTGKRYSVGEYIVDEYSDGSVAPYIGWGGPLGDNTIDAWALRAMKAEGLSDDNNAGYLATFYYPQMEPWPTEARGKDAKITSLQGIRTFRGHTGKRADLKYVLRPTED